MGKLIDADPVLDNLSGRLESMKDYDAVKDVINNMPIAYDVDKVAEKLEKRRMDALRHLRENKGTEFGYASECVYNALNEAVEIVKGGGVDE